MSPTPAPPALATVSSLATPATRWLTARAPARVDFTGAYTDILPFCETRPGHAVNCAVAQWAVASGALRPDGRIVLDLPDLAVHVDVPHAGELAGATPSPLVEAIVSELLDGRGATIRVTARAPFGSGLGGSGALGVALAGLLLALTGRSLEPCEVAELAAGLERRSGSLGGRQDQYAAALGGAHLFSFSAAEVRTERLVVGPRTRAALRDEFTLVHPGGTRASTALVGPVMQRYAEGDPDTTRHLQALNDGASAIRAALVDDDPGALAAVVGHVAAVQRRLSPLVASPELQALEAELRPAVVDVVKPTGSGGRGNCLLVHHRPGWRPRVVDHARRQGFAVLPFVLTTEGLSVRPTLAAPGAVPAGAPA